MASSSRPNKEDTIEVLESGSVLEAHAHFVTITEDMPLLRRGAVIAAAAGNMAVVRYFCEARGVPVNFVPSDETHEIFGIHVPTPLSVALLNGHEDLALYLLSLPRMEESPPLNLDGRPGYKTESPLLTLAAQKGLVRVVEVFLDLGANLLVRDKIGHQAVCWAAIKCHVEVLNVLLEAHARQGGGGGGVKAVLECCCIQGTMANTLLHHANIHPGITPDARLAMVRCLVQKWGANVRAISLVDRLEYYPLYVAAVYGAQEVVAFFLDECGMDVNLQMPRTKDTVLHALMRSRLPRKRDAVRLLKYLVEEKGADFTIKNADGQNARDLSFQYMNGTYFTYFLSSEYELPEGAADMFNSEEWGTAEDDRQILLAAGAMAMKAKEAEAKALLEEQELKAKEATAALLAELDAEDRQAAAATGRKKSKKKANKKKGTGS